MENDNVKRVENLEAMSNIFKLNKELISEVKEKI